MIIVIQTESVMSEVKLTFTTEQLPVDEAATVKAFTLWAKSRHAVTHAFPNLHQSAYYKQIQLYGIQKFWELTWIDRLHHTSSLGETDHFINSCWAAMIDYQLTKLWPTLDHINEYNMNHLIAIHRATNKVKGSKFHGVSVASKCICPDHLEGFIDLYADITGNNYLTKWATECFLAKSAIKSKSK